MSESDKGGLLRRHGLAPEEIEPLSFDIIDKLIPVEGYSARELQVVKRIVHTTGDPGIAEHVRFHPRALAAGVESVRRGRPLFTDVKMVAAGINRRLAAKFGCRVDCLIDAPGVAEEAREQSITRSAAGVRLFRSEFRGAVVAIGNAPTALLALLDLLDEGCPPPGLIIGVPVGFVGAAESKAELARRDFPYVAIEGTRGGSTVAAAIVNAILKIADKEGYDAHL